MNFNVVNASQLNSQHSSYCIYAKPGTGKTTAIAYIPGRTLLVDIDKSSTVLGKLNINHIDVIKINSWNIWNEWMTFVMQYTQNPSLLQGYSTLVIDNVSELFRSALANLGRDGKNQGVPSQADYQRVDFAILDSLRALTNLPIRVVFTAWETTDLWQAENGQSFNRSFPDIRPKILNNFLGLFDVVAKLVTYQTEDGKTERGFILEGNQSVEAKDRLHGRSACRVHELVIQEGG